MKEIKPKLLINEASDTERDGTKNFIHYGILLTTVKYCTRL
jgi:hypothetical protein